VTVETVATGDKTATPAWVRTLLSLAGTLVAMSALVWLLGANPLEVVEAIVLGALSS
jgi:NADH:ubiquinone oxidoreductase subunit 6 (subunit J)